jgi:hypothetical protein
MFHTQDEQGNGRWRLTFTPFTLTFIMIVTGPAP